ncbi:hypothetical protein BT96DRAFT_832660 [Gymnopus androsaceus JB14]|uniref:DDE-1 domain-containing protein n=1 Tax=Gymnopus androsaceus JB14 TaxID=1447944 RepID=A0A6A4GYW2_9AGAR|nr:hypothetical protein BT96DRAFT_832660 [Gymnopus androsaceus JB14]
MGRICPHRECHKEARDLCRVCVFPILWAVHHSKEFRSWMRKNHLNIILDYVPGGCTSVGQPCDVGMQRLFKLATKRSYHEDVVQNFMKQIQDDKKGTGTLTVDNRIPTL